MPQVTHQTRFPHVAASDLFAMCERPGAFLRLAPPWQGVRLIGQRGTIRNGDTLTFSVPAGPLRLEWHAVHRDYEAGRQFCDVQGRGPFAKWHHTHRFEDCPGGGSLMTDDIDFSMPLAPIGNWLGAWLPKSDLQRLFRFREARIAEDFSRPQRQAGSPIQRVGITGATGLIGRHLAAYLGTRGYGITKFVRGAQPSAPDQVAWNPATGDLSPGAMEGLDAVVHLAAAGIADRRWNDRVKRDLVESRLKGTRLLCEKLAQLQRKPSVLVAASASGYYGSRGDDPIDETAQRGDGFLPELCEQWEAATKPASEAGIRVVNLRIGVVLAPDGGALAKMLPPFLAGVGGVLGTGKQGMRWIAIDDLLYAIQHAMLTPSITGPVNATAPQQVNNREFTKTLGRVLRRPTVFPVPGFAARLAFGEMADDLLLQGANILPNVLINSGFRFAYPHLEPALRFLLGR